MPDSEQPIPESLLKELERGARHIHLGGLSGSSKAYLLSRLLQMGPGRTFVYLAPRAREAVRFQQDLRFFLAPFAEGETLFFPAHDVLPFTNLSPHNQINCDRMSLLYALTRTAPPSLITTTPAAVMGWLPPKGDFEKPLQVKVGQELDRDDFLRRLTELGYQNVPLVIDRGNFAVRGALIDLFCPQDRHPVRIEWMGDTVEAIRAFDPKTQRSVATKSGSESVSLRPDRLHD